MTESSGQGACPICGSTSEPRFFRREPATEDPWRVSFHAMQVDVVRCRDCRAVYVNRAFPESLLEGFYKERVGGGQEVNLENFGWWLQATEGAVHHLLRTIEREPRGPLLDVGCGYGTLVYLARSYGWTPTALEINGTLARFVREELHIPCIEGLLHDSCLPLHHFSVVVLFDVLEHIYAPVDMLSRCRELLAPGGVVVIKSPNWKMQYVKEQLRYRAGWGTGNIATIGHINQFDRRSLTRAFARAGFEPMGVSPSHSFLPGIRGCEFSLRWSTEYLFKRTFNITTNLVYRATGANLAFNLLGVARNPH